MKPYFRKNSAPLTIGFFVGIAVVLAIFGASHCLWKWQLKTEQGHIWEIILKAIAGAVGVVGAILTAFKYIDEKTRTRKQDLELKLRQWEQDRREDQKVFIVERQAIYRRLGLALADIVNHDPDAEKDKVLWLEVKEAFFKIYWGELRLVADKNVLTAVEPFSDQLDAAKNSEDKKALAQLVPDIMDCCRHELGNAWRGIHEAERVSKEEISKATSAASMRKHPGSG